MLLCDAPPVSVGPVQELSPQNEPRFFLSQLNHNCSTHRVPIFLNVGDTHSNFPPPTSGSMGVPPSISLAPSLVTSPNLQLYMIVLLNPSLESPSSHPLLERSPNRRNPTPRSISIPILSSPQFFPGTADKTSAPAARRSISTSG